MRKRFKLLKSVKRSELPGMKENRWFVERYFPHITECNTISTYFSKNEGKRMKHLYRSPIKSRADFQRLSSAKFAVQIFISNLKHISGVWLSI